jgi:comEA protein
MWGMTRAERGVILFLVAGLLLGMGVWWFRSDVQPLPMIKEETPRSSERSHQSIETDEAGFTHSPIYPISINRSTSQELQNVPGIGPVTAGRIIDFRIQNGPFRSLGDLMEVKGIGSKTMEKIKPYIKL